MEVDEVRRGVYGLVVRMKETCGGARGFLFRGSGGGDCDSCGCGFHSCDYHSGDCWGPGMVSFRPFADARQFSRLLSNSLSVCFTAASFSRFSNWLASRCMFVLALIGVCFVQERGPTRHGGRCRPRAKVCLVPLSIRAQSSSPVRRGLHF